MLHSFGDWSKALSHRMRRSPERESDQGLTANTFMQSSRTFGTQQRETLLQEHTSSNSDIPMKYSNPSTVSVVSIEKCNEMRKSNSLTNYLSSNERRSSDLEVQRREKLVSGIYEKGAEYQRNRKSNTSRERLENLIEMRFPSVSDEVCRVYI